MQQPTGTRYQYSAGAKENSSFSWRGAGLQYLDEESVKATRELERKQATARVLEWLEGCLRKLPNRVQVIIGGDLNLQVATAPQFDEDLAGCEGLDALASELEATKQRRMNKWMSMIFPYGSEFAWDSTGHEEINTWLLRFGHDAPWCGRPQG